VDQFEDSALTYIIVGGFLLRSLPERDFTPRATCSIHTTTRRRCQSPL